MINLCRKPSTKQNIVMNQTIHPSKNHWDFTLQTSTTSVSLSLMPPLPLSHARHHHHRPWWTLTCMTFWALTTPVISLKSKSRIALFRSAATLTLLALLAMTLVIFVGLIIPKYGENHCPLLCEFRRWV